MNDEILDPETADFPVVGIGASAGGLAAFEAFFSGAPVTSDPGMAFVLVQHLSADHKSLLAELIQLKTKMKVFEIEDGMKVKPNCIYIIPPGRDLAFIHGGFQLLEPAQAAGHRLPIDFFFRSLAQDLRGRAIGIVLSGTGGDGTLGIRAIKGEGGLVMAQTLQSAEFTGMPQSAISTDLVDFELPPSKMIPQLMTYVSHSYGQLTPKNNLTGSRIQNAVTKVFLLLRAQTGHDFSQYKPNTIHRRIERRMAVHQITDIEGYVKFLQQSPDEVEALFRDMLIGVTNFFRDSAAFRALAEIAIPKIFDSKPAGATIRIWIAGCSTGEEAYSVAILFLEMAKKVKGAYRIQVFATDIDDRAISFARAGVYPSSIAADVSADILTQYFVASLDGNSYRIQKSVRDMIVFSKQDLIKDPPFSKLDFISCRNLMIYFGIDLQKKLIPLFHYSLNRSGVLFLGTSEGVGEFDQLFSVLDRTSKLFSSKEGKTGAQKTVPGRLVSSLPDLTTHFDQHLGQAMLNEKKSLRQIAERALLKNVFAAGVLINGQGDILYIHGRTGLFLEPSPGESGVNNILKMAREGLNPTLTTTIRKAIDTGDVIHHPQLNIRTNGHFSVISLMVCPVAEPLKDMPLYLVIFEEKNTDLMPSAPTENDIKLSAKILTDPEKRTPPEQAPAKILLSDLEHEVAVLKERLKAKKEFLESTQEELMSSNEELKSSNEEMQSMNEELQSSNEELETSKEELQSINEELSTVNVELQTKVADLSRANNDMNNLISGTGIGTVFVDHQLKILRFTPVVCTIINLIQSDMGRPISHIVSNFLNYQNMTVDILSVLENLVPCDREVQTVDGKWFSMRIKPYRTMDNIIEGAVISFLDITEIVQARKNLEKIDELSRSAAVIRDSFDAITVHELNGQTIAWNPGAIRQYGWSESEALTMNFFERVPKELQAKEKEFLAQQSETRIIQPYETKRIKKDGSLVPISVISSVLINSAGVVYAIATKERLMNEGKK